MNATPDYQMAEQYLGDIVRYLKCCKTPPPGSQIPSTPRYPNIKQVFVTSRIYAIQHNKIPSLRRRWQFIRQEGCDHLFALVVIHPDVCPTSSPRQRARHDQIMRTDILTDNFEF
jgi:hypothetical protein